MLLFESMTGGKRIWLVNYACHPVIVQAQPRISADFPGVLQTLVETQYPDTTCLFLQGACADLNPIMDDSRDFDDVTRFGAALAGECLALARSAGLTCVLQCTNYAEQQQPDAALPRVQYVFEKHADA